MSKIPTSETLKVNKSDNRAMHLNKNSISELFRYTFGVSLQYFVIGINKNGLFMNLLRVKISFSGKNLRKTLAFILVCVQLKKENPP